MMNRILKLNELVHFSPSIIFRYSMKDENGQMILAHRGSGSGGYLDYVFRSAAKELFQIDMNADPLEFKVTKYCSVLGFKSIIIFYFY